MRWVHAREGRPALAWRQRKAGDGLGMAYINDTANQEEIGEGVERGGGR